MKSLQLYIFVFLNFNKYLIKKINTRANGNYGNQNVFACISAINRFLVNLVSSFDRGDPGLSFTANFSWDGTAGCPL